MNKGMRALAPAAAVGLLVLLAAPAAAATLAQSEATAINGELLGTPLVGTGTSTAANDGSEPVVRETISDAISVLPGQDAASTGAVAQAAIATDDGLSAACAGVVGEGGAISVGDDGTCTPDDGTSPALVDLADIPLVGTLQLRAGAVYGSCTAGLSDSTDGYSAQAHLVDAALLFDPLVGGVVTIPLTLGQPVALPAVLAPLVTLNLNQTDSDASDGVVSATALELSVLGGLGLPPVTELTIGDVTCGPNATAAEVPMVPMAGASVAAGTAVLMGLGVYFVHRRRRSTDA